MWPLGREDFFMPTKDPEKLKAARDRYEAKRLGRTRNFATVIYPESAPADWMDKLDQYHVQALISPLHDKDVNPNGELKKAHYHVMVMFDRVKNFDTQVKPLFDEIGAVGREEVVSARGYARYLCHLDNPEKTPYSPSEVHSLGGANYNTVIGSSVDDVQMLGEIMDYIVKNGIYSLADLLMDCKEYHSEWFYLLTMSKCYVIDKFIKSFDWERKNGYVRFADREQIDESTGEVLPTCGKE